MFTIYKWSVFTICLLTVALWFVILFGSIFGGIYAVFFNRKLISHPITLLSGFKEDSKPSENTYQTASESDPH